MRRTGKILLLSLMVLTASCGIFKPHNAVTITKHETILEILKEHFPDLYDLHEQDRIEVDEIYFYHDRKGRPKYKVSLRYIPPHAH